MASSKGEGKGARVFTVQAHLITEDMLWDVRMQQDASKVCAGALGVKLVLTKADRCCVCQDDMGAGTDVVRLLCACELRVHRDCWAQWVKVLRDQGSHVKCVQCKTTLGSGHETGVARRCSAYTLKAGIRSVPDTSCPRCFEPVLGEAHVCTSFTHVYHIECAAKGELCCKGSGSTDSGSEFEP